MALAGLGLAASGAARAASLPPPSGKPILTVTGRIGATNRDGAALLDREMIEALGMASIRTSTPWYTGAVTFEGVPMAKLMGLVQAAGSSVLAVALNDYSTEIPMEDFAAYNVMLALKRDGDYMPVRDKGPLFIVYPFDSRQDLQQQKFYSRSAWQLSRLVVK